MTEDAQHRNHMKSSYNQTIKDTHAQRQAGHPSDNQTQGLYFRGRSERPNNGESTLHQGRESQQLGIGGVAKRQPTQVHNAQRRETKPKVSHHRCRTHDDKHRSTPHRCGQPTKAAVRTTITSAKRDAGWMRIT